MKKQTLLAHPWIAPQKAMVRNVLRQVKRSIFQTGVSALMTRHWSPYSRLFLVSDHPGWVISWEMRQLASIAQHLGARVVNARWLPYVYRQVVFYGSSFQALASNSYPDWTHHLGFAYFHGRPGTGVPEFDQKYHRLCQVHHRIQRIQVSHSEMHEVVLNSGIASEKVFRIPIGIDLSFFQMQTTALRQAARKHLNIPESAVVVGSFQKDGVGWGEGMEPKLIKGPDIFLQAMEQLHSRIPELFVLLSGPARGHVKTGLERLGIPYCHVFLEHYPDIGQLYQALDLYMVTSRQEGGPKAVLESMASGVPLVTTRVGQAMDLVRHGENGWMVEVEDVEGLAHWTEFAIQHRESLSGVIEHAYQTASEHTYEAQVPLWREFMRGFVELTK